MIASTLASLAAAALLPPLALVALLAAALIVHRRRARIAMVLIFAATFALYALSTPWVGGLLQKSLETGAPVRPDELAGAQAIVVLSGGSYHDAAEYGGDTVNGISLERLRYAVRLHRASGLPLLVTGGVPGGGSRAEGRLLDQVLREEYGIAARWVEDAARTTWDNAVLSAPLLRRDGVHRIALVSHAWHLRRAAPLFEAQGLGVVPAGIRYASIRLDSVFDLVPTPNGLRDSTYALHEWLGILWYKLRSLSSRGKP